QDPGVAVSTPGAHVIFHPGTLASRMRAHTSSKPSPGKVSLGAGPPRPATPCSTNCGDDSSTPHTRRAPASVTIPPRLDRGAPAGAAGHTLVDRRLADQTILEERHHVADGDARGGLAGVERAIDQILAGGARRLAAGAEAILPAEAGLEVEAAEAALAALEGGARPAPRAAP